MLLPQPRRLPGLLSYEAIDQGEDNLAEAEDFPVKSSPVPPIPRGEDRVPLLCCTYSGWIST